MPQCDICQRKSVFGNTVEQRGKAKYLGGNGRKTTGISRRMFHPNVQKIRIADADGNTLRKNVCVSCLRSGKVQKAVKRKLFTLDSHAARD
jgi:large subunit ribosomal protein L28